MAARRFCIFAALILGPGSGCAVKINHLDTATLSASGTVRIHNPLAFTGNSAATAPVANRVFYAGTTPYWTLTGTCDPDLGSVQFKDSVDSLITTIPCQDDGTFSASIAHSSGVGSPSFGKPGTMRAYQAGAVYAKTRLYPMPGTTSTFITNQAQLAAIGAAGNYILTSDITLSGNWTPINSFTSGYLMGDGHTVSNLTIVGGGGFPIGFFNNSASAVIDGINFTNVSVTGATGASAVLIGSDTGYSTLTNVTVSTAVVSGGFSMGGLVGSSGLGLAIFASSYQGSVTGTGASVAGIAGTCGGCMLGNNYVSANVSGSNNVGGIAGSLTSPGGPTVVSENEYVGIVTASGGGSRGGEIAGSVTATNGAYFIRNFAAAVIVGVAGGHAGQITGQIDATGVGTTLTSNYYLSSAACTNCDISTGTGLTALQASYAASFPGFDFTTPVWLNLSPGTSYIVPRN